MLLLNKERFLKLPAGVFYIQVPGRDYDPSTAMITNSIMVKGNSFESIDCYEGNLSFAPTPEDTGERDWPCIGNVYDEDKGFSESMDLNLTITRGGLIGEEDIRFIVFEPKDLATMAQWMEKAALAMTSWLKEQDENYPEVMKATKNTFDDEDFK
ncbi:hypothetical protein OGA59_004480 [Salmonella enterica]|nr:hypothetical protein [Salmonella enterica]